MATTSAATPARGPVRRYLEEFFGDLTLQLSNFWFGMTLLAIWGFMTLIGVVVDQGKEPAYYFGAYGPPLARLILRLHLDNIYHGAGYIAMIGAIIACMTLATFKRVIPARMPPLHPVRVEKIPLNATVILPGEPNAVRERVEAFFRERGWLVRKRELGGVEWTFADKANWARRGVLIAHIGFVLIAAGTTMYWLWGYSGQTAILAGTQTVIPENGTRLKLDAFAYRFDPIHTRSGLIYQPIDYVSNLHVTGRNGVTEARVLRVNEPLDIDGTLYYQATYGSAVAFRLTKDGKPVAGAPAEPLKEGEALSIGTTARSVRYDRFVGTIDARGGAAADPRANNPGALLEVFDGDQSLGTALVPLGRGIALGNGYRLEAGRYTLFSGIQYRHDPGIPLVGLGAFVLLFGLCVSFYFLPARLYVRVDPAPGGAAVGVAATTVKGFEIFEEQFQTLVDALRRTAQAS